MQFKNNHDHFTYIKCIFSSIMMNKEHNYSFKNNFSAVIIKGLAVFSEYLDLEKTTLSAIYLIIKAHFSILLSGSKKGEKKDFAVYSIIKVHSSVLFIKPYNIFNLLLVILRN